MIRSISRLLQDPETLRRVFKAYASDINNYYYCNSGSDDYNSSGESHMMRDWDNMIILDACRFDMFAELAVDKISKNTDCKICFESFISKASSTPEFLYSNIHKKSFLDTVYVTANPMFTRLTSNKYSWSPERLQSEFYEVCNIWEDKGWDETHNTVLPKTVYNYTVEQNSRHPNKRLLIHFIQPHYPFIGFNLIKSIKTTPDPEVKGDDIWSALGGGSLPPTEETLEKVWSAYTHNLERTIPSVIQLIKRLNGTTVITSDHGNMIGERSFPIPVQIYGHPSGIYTKELVKVPWMEIKGEQRKNIKVEAPSKTPHNSNDEDVDERLRSLGYKI